MTHYLVVVVNSHEAYLLMVSFW